ncbi:hypothetical protein [Acinetobacter sp. YH12145]|uniref:hypothetical protein n=1 Tax=Acinetobacter sp. YH12145 TaxID=2601129 RepID=UPI0015D364A8|nr:hypothetical protein [Acinetobacter sp. YH12145]
MRPNCPVCNSIQTKLTSQNSIFIPFSNYKCKNCGHDFVLKHQKKKGGCLWSIVKFTLSALFLGFILIWLFKDELPQQSNTKTHDTSEQMLLSENTHYEDETNGINDMEPKQSIKDSLDPSDTLSIKTEI